jgi:hypothetical protein
MGVKFNNPTNQLVYYPDGILPADYPDAYEELLFTCCVHLTRPAYQFEHIFVGDEKDTRTLAGASEKAMNM